MGLSETLSQIQFCEIRKYSDRIYRVKVERETNDADGAVIRTRGETDTILPYYCCKTKSPYMGECPRPDGPDGTDSSQCPACTRVVYKYIIYDLNDNDVKARLNDHVFLDYDAFLFFQEYNISNMFFGENDYVRFNTYILFVAESSDQFPDNPDLRNRIELDLNYARKKFILQENLCEFATIPSGKRAVTIDNTEHSPLSAYVVYEDYIDKVVGVLQRENLSGFLVDAQEDYKCEKQLREHLNNKKKKRDLSNYNSDMLKDGALGLDSKKDFILEYFNSDIKPDLTRAKLHLRKVLFENYREKLSIPKDIDFELVTLFFAENTFGKTTILDGISNAFVGSKLYSGSRNVGNERFTVIVNDETGTIDKEYIAASSVDNKESSKSVLLNKIDGTTSAQKRERRHELSKRKSTFYPLHTGELGDLFRTINYFELDAVAKFALGDDVLRHLFANEAVDLFCRRVDMLKAILNNEIEDFDRNIAPPVAREAAKTEKTWYKNQIEMDNMRAYCRYLLNELEEKTKDMPQYDWKTDIKNNLNVVNTIYRKLHSFEEEIVCNGDITVVDAEGSEKTKMELSAAQRACVALAIAFSQFLTSNSALDFMLLDEPMANLDNLHLLNLFDLLRDMAIEGHQIVLATASQTFADIARVKFHCLGEGYNSLDIDTTEKMRGQPVLATV